MFSLTCDWILFCSSSTSSCVASRGRDHAQAFFDIELFEDAVSPWTSACRLAARKSASADGLLMMSEPVRFIRRVRRKLDHSVGLCAHAGEQRIHARAGVSLSSRTSILPTANGSVFSSSISRNRAMPCTMID